MRGCWLNRGLIAAIGVAAVLAAVPASADSGWSAPAARLAVPVEVPVMLPDASAAPSNVLHNPLGEITGTFDLTESLSLQTSINADIARILDHYTAGAFDGLFYSGAALGSSYTDLASGGNFSSLHAKLIEGLGLSFGVGSISPGLNRYLVTPRTAYAAMGGRLPFDYRYANSVLASMNWNFARWGGMAVTASQTAEHGGAVGTSNAAVNARTQAVGVSARVSFGGGWVTTASYSEGLTQLALRPGALTADTTLRGESFGVAVAKHGLFSRNDALGVSFARPAPNFSASLNNGDQTSELQFFGNNRLTASTAPETDIELGYKTQFFGDTVALQANASYQMNFGGVNGNNAVSLLSRARIRF